MNSAYQLALHKGFVRGGVLGLVFGFLFMWMGMDKTEGFFLIILGLIFLLVGVATAFARDKEGN